MSELSKTDFGLIFLDLRKKSDFKEKDFEKCEVLGVFRDGVSCDARCFPPEDQCAELRTRLSVINSFAESPEWRKGKKKKKRSKKYRRRLAAKSVFAPLKAVCVVQIGNTGMPGVPINYHGQRLWGRKIKECSYM